MLIDLRVKHDVGAWDIPSFHSIPAWAAGLSRAPTASEFSSLARGMSSIPGRAFSCWTSRGGCSASRCSERHAGISRDRARGAVRARTGNAVSVWAASRIR